MSRRPARAGRRGSTNGSVLGPTADVGATVDSAAMTDSALSPETYEKLGLFYLGRPWDLDGDRPLPGAVLYDSRDLLTHALCVGMTGSGKTGLCITLLEEAALDGVPSLVIDPKGDLGNLLLTFPT